MSKLDTTLKVGIEFGGVKLSAEYVLEQGPESVRVIVEDVLKGSESVFNLLEAFADLDQLRITVENALVKRDELHWDNDGNL